MIYVFFYEFKKNVTLELDISKKVVKGVNYGYFTFKIKDSYQSIVTFKDIL